MNLSTVLIVVLALGWVISRNLKGRFVATGEGGKAYRLPLVLIVLGVVEFGQAHPAITPVAVLVIGADLLLTAALGAARGYSIQLSTRDGYLYQRGGAPTLLLWALSIAVRVGLEFAAHSLGAGAAASGTVVLTFGVSLVVQAFVLQSRVREDGRPVRPARDRRGSGRDGSRDGSGRDSSGRDGSRLRRDGSRLGRAARSDERPVADQGWSGDGGRGPVGNGGWDVDGQDTRRIRRSH
ncbi:MAG TPA: hypothetical protein VH141_27405 [Pseudonocardia sp.]|nr:hypothetical protein [Pseudonocardia sp.]